MNILDKIDKYITEAAEKEELKKKVVEFIVKNPNPMDSKFHSFAEKLGEDPDDLEAVAYSILSDFWTKGRFEEKGKNLKIDDDQLKMGIEVEYEHTSSKAMSERIAKDHLTEIPDYYTRLKKMEEEAGIKD